MTSANTDSMWMAKALSLAQCAADQGEVPVGAVLVRDERAIATGWNQPIARCDPTAHAEVIALREAADVLGNYRCLNTTLYVTLEPCLMCVGALLHARVSRVVFGAFDGRASVSMQALLSQDPYRFNHQVVWQGGVMEAACADVLRTFFKNKRR